MTVHAVVLAAGKGTRMNSDLAKVLHRAAGRTLLAWTLAALEGVDEITVVVGHQADDVAATLPEGVRTALQQPQNGTGHATEVGLGAASPASGDVVLVMPGDMPLISAATVAALLDTHSASAAAATVLTAVVGDPTGYGRVIRDDDGVRAIVEHRDAGPDELAVHEINTSVYAFDAQLLVEALGRVGADNDQGERYLTDVVAVLSQHGAAVHAVRADALEAMGVNSHAELAEVAAELRRRINHAWMQHGVAMVDPARVYLDADVRLAPGVALYPDVHLEGNTTVEAGAVLGPGVFAVDCSIGPRSRVTYSVLDGVALGEEAIVGPYAHLRPGTDLGAGAKAGSFVEVKASSIGKGAKVPHLAYVGDAEVGEGANIGAGSITVNYDGYAKHRTVIGDRARIGSDTMLVAPVEIGDDAYTAAGSVITRDVSPGALGVERSTQREIPGYAARRKRRAEREQP
jgi:bifunctional UDP-N-acetylglucosamine pyrophosphorylase/glucosamine-1-phosphate N-acetyltransferase